MSDISYLLFALLLVVANGFFVAAEFAVIKARPYRLEELVRAKRMFAPTARWLQHRMDGTLAACQFGITMASLGLGWVGEPAFARLLEPLLRAMSVESERAVHGISFAVAFSAITALHLVAGEQVPKIFAIRRAEVMVLWCAPAMKAFYFLAFPFMWMLSIATNRILALVGVKGATGHGETYTEDEIRALLAEARTAGELSKTEDRLIRAVFDFDDRICRQVMLPRRDVEFFDVEQPVDVALALAAKSRHSRYPLCEGSLDKLLGVVHTRDLVGLVDPATTDLRALARDPHRLPQSMPISSVLRHFQAVQQHMAFVVDEFGNIIGVVTIDHVLEEIVGPVDDEFDVVAAPIVEDGEHKFRVRGSAGIDAVNAKTGLELGDAEADTLSGLLVIALGRLPRVGDVVELAGARAEVLEARDGRAEWVRLQLAPG